MNDEDTPGRRDRSPVPLGSLPAVDRRRVLAALGMGALGSTAGCASSGGGATTDPPTADAPTSTGTTRTTMSTRSTDTDDPIDRQFGYTGTSMDESPPVEPDNTVQLVIEPREDAPVPAFYFQPSGLEIQPGDVVRFDFPTPEHTVSAYHPNFGRTRRIPEGVPPFSSPLLGANSYWLYRFDEPGVYDLFCAPHELFGMAMRIVVGDEPAGPGAEPVKESAGEDGLRPPWLTSGLVLSDPALAPENILDLNAVGWSAVADESKRLLVEFPGDG